MTDDRLFDVPVALPGDRPGNAYDEPMTQQPKARRTDPATSHEAARSVTNLTAKQKAVYDVLREHGPMTDADLVAKYQDLAAGGWHERQSESGIRTRRSELTDRRVVVATAQGRSPSGRRAIVWAATVEER